MGFEKLFTEPTKNLNDDLELNKKINRFSGTIKNTLEVDTGKSSETSDSKKYEIKENEVTVKWKKYLPEGVAPEEIPENQAVIFLPGFNNTEDASKVSALSQELADYSKSQAYAITTRAEKITPDILDVESEAIYQMMIENGLKEITLFGHSTGGGKSLILASMMADSPEINLNGLVLINSVSLYEQSDSSFALNFAKDAKVTTSQINNLPDTQQEEVRKMSEKYVNEGRQETIKEAKRSGIDMPKRLLSQVKDASSISPVLDKIKAPIVLVQGKYDLLSKPEKTIPEADSYIENYHEREKYLQENVFINSPFVRLIIADKLGNHNLPYFRPEAVAKTSIYLLNRWHRDKK